MHPPLTLSSFAPRWWGSTAPPPAAMGHQTSSTTCLPYFQAHSNNPGKSTRQHLGSSQQLPAVLLPGCSCACSRTRLLLTAGQQSPLCRLVVVVSTATQTSKMSGVTMVQWHMCVHSRFMSLDSAGTCQHRHCAASPNFQGMCAGNCSCPKTTAHFIKSEVTQREPALPWVEQTAHNPPETQNL